MRYIMFGASAAVERVRARRRSPARPRSGPRRIARLDLDRGRRTGAPEVVLAEGKTPDHLAEIVRELARRGRGALISRPTLVQRRRLAALAQEGLPLHSLAAGRLVRLAGPVHVGVVPGHVAILTAGTADIPVAQAAEELLRALGLRPICAYDVGVAGIHRLARALRRIERWRPVVYLVFAGREGALPTVVAGLVRAPVIGVPTSVGYGRGGRGEAALTAMLQSCAPLAGVNIDAAVPAALFAAQLLAGRARGSLPPAVPRSGPGGARAGRRLRPAGRGPPPR